MAGTVGVNFSLGANVSRTVSSAFGTISSRVRGLKGELADLNKQSKTASRLTTAQTRLQSVREQYAAGKTDATRAALRTASLEYGRAKLAAQQYGIGVQNAARAQTVLTGRIESTQAALTRQQRLMANQAKRGEIQGQMLGTVATAMALAAPVKMAIDYESEFADLKKVADFANAEQENRVRQDIFDVARMSGIDAAGMTKIAASAAESGAANDAGGKLDPERLKQFLTDAAQMSVAYGISAEEAGDRLATLQGRMGLVPDQTRAMGDAMNYVASKTNATAAATLNVVARMGAVGQTAGLSEKSIVGLAAAFVSTSENQETAGTAMKAFLSNLIAGEKMTKQQQETFAELGIRNVQALAEGMKRGGPEAENTIMTVLEAIRKAPEAAQAGIAKQIFGLESLASVAPLINNPQKLADMFRMANSGEAAGSQLREFKTRSETTQGAIDRLKTSTGILAVTVGSLLLPPISTAAKIMTTIVQPVTVLAERFPVVTRTVMLTGIALIGLKVGAMAGIYAATLLSDGWLYATRIVNFFRPSVLATNAALLYQRGAAIAAAVGTRIMGAGARIGAAGQWLLNAAMSANPIGIVIRGVALLVGGLVYLYNTCEPVRAAFDAVFGFIGEKVGWVLGKLRSVAEWLGLVDEADETADRKIAEAQTASTAAPPSSTALPPLSPAAPQAWTPPANLDPASATAALGGMGADGQLPAMPQTTGAAGMAGGMNFNMTIPLNGITDGDFAKRVFDALNRRKSEVEALISGIVDEQRRLTYGNA